MYQRKKHLEFFKEIIKSINLFLLLLVSILCHGQTQEADSIRRLLVQPLSDTSRILLLVRLSNTYNFFQTDSAIILARQAIEEARNLQFIRGEGRGLNSLGAAQRLQGDLPHSLESHLQALQISRSAHDEEEEIRSLVHIGNVYAQLSEYRQSLFYLQQARKINEHFQHVNVLLLSSFGDAYEHLNLLDSALLFQQQAHTMLKDLPRGTLGSLVLTRLGYIQFRLQNNSGALRYYQDALENASIIGDLLNRGRIQYRIAEVYHKLRQPDSSLHYAHLAFINSQYVSQSTQLNASNLLVKLYSAKGKLDSAFHYQEMAM